MSYGWSVNLSSTADEHTFETELPVPPLWVGRFGPVVEVVFWSERAQRWMHGVSEPFERPLPDGHVQVTVGDLAWISQVEKSWGEQALMQCLRVLEEEQVPE